VATTNNKFLVKNGLAVGEAIEVINSSGQWIGATGTLSGASGIGETGLTGATGVQGVQGASGSTGLTGSTGIDGASGIQGASGSTGPTGTNGTNGATGTQGGQGVQGASGSTGLTGATGSAPADVYYSPTFTSPSGSYSSFSGSTSDIVTAGDSNVYTIEEMGSDSYSFNVEFSHSIPSFNVIKIRANYNGTTPINIQVFNHNTFTHDTIGTFGSTTGYVQREYSISNSVPYIDTGDYVLLKLEQSTSSSANLYLDYVTVGQLVNGVNGADGASGVQGASGANGASGVRGASGIQGASGSTGLIGASGASGATGIQGASGSTGVGTQGASGSTGVGTQGASGSTGLTGASGFVGSDGATGTQGASGSTGLTGASGFVGSDGATGIQGASGSTGLTGASGFVGSDGATGIQGASGSTGLGTQGASGSTGLTGLTGATGPAGTGGGGGGGLTPSVISTNTNAVISTLYVFTASLTLTLPASPSAGDVVAFTNLSNTLTCVIGRNSLKIMGLNEDMTVDVIDSTMSLMYTGATYGWVVS
jgi:hypothetical protein